MDSDGDIGVSPTTWVCILLSMSSRTPRASIPTDWASPEKSKGRNAGRDRMTGIRKAATILERLIYESQPIQEGTQKTRRVGTRVAGPRRLTQFWRAAPHKLKSYCSCTFTFSRVRGLTTRNKLLILIFLLSETARRTLLCCQLKIW